MTLPGISKSGPALTGEVSLGFKRYCEDEESSKRCEKLCSEELLKCLETCEDDYICESTCFRLNFTARFLNF